MMDTRICHDCRVGPGDPHRDGCDTARCLRTGGQRLTCGIRPVFAGGELVTMEEYDAHPGEDCGQDIWTGQWPGEADAIRLGLWCYFVPGADPSWVPCGPDQEGARPDLNRLVVEARWSRETLRWEARQA